MKNMRDNLRGRLIELTPRIMKGVKRWIRLTVQLSPVNRISDRVGLRL